jgi:hypothetical protein
MNDLFDISGTNRTLKVPIRLKSIKTKKVCINHSKLERDARKRVRSIKKYQITINRKVGRSFKDVRNKMIDDYDEYEEEY